MTIFPVMLSNYLFIREDRRKYRREDKTRKKTNCYWKTLRKREYTAK
jgi:hypothetical protein